MLNKFVLLNLDIVSVMLDRFWIPLKSSKACLCFHFSRQLTYHFFLNFCGRFKSQFSSVSLCYATLSLMCSSEIIILKVVQVIQIMLQFPKPSLPLFGSALYLCFSGVKHWYLMMQFKYSHLSMHSQFKACWYMWIYIQN